VERLSEGEIMLIGLEWIGGAILYIEGEGVAERWSGVRDL
jgi:hypothetical protein